MCDVSQEKALVRAICRKSKFSEKKIICKAIAAMTCINTGKREGGRDKTYHLRIGFKGKWI